MNDIELSESNSIKIHNDTANLIAASVAQNTLKAYQHATIKIEEWLQGRRLDDHLLATYITQLFHRGKSPATISLVVAAVKWTVQTAGLPPVAGKITNKTLAGIRREGKKRGRGQVDGLIWSDVERVCAYAEATGTIGGLRDSAMIRLMSDCLLRISEVVAVDIDDLSESTLMIRSSKTDPQGIGESLYVTSDTRQAIQQYQQAAGVHQGALFRRILFGKNVTATRLSANGARDAIKRRSHEAGVEGFISGHSLRVGSAISLAQAGASVVDMQVAGRWKSSQMPAHYAKAELAERGAIARFKEKRKKGR